MRVKVYQPHYEVDEPILESDITLIYMPFDLRRMQDKPAHGLKSSARIQNMIESFQRLLRLERLLQLSCLLMAICC